MGILILLAPFIVIGAGMAYLITYDELSRHYTDRRRARREAALRAAVALLFLLALSALSAVIVGHH